MRNVRPFGVFVEMEGYRRHGLVHNSQVSEDIAFSREDEDEAKVKAMEFFAPVGSQVRRLLCLHAAVVLHLPAQKRGFALPACPPPAANVAWPQAPVAACTARRSG